MKKYLFLILLVVISVGGFGQKKDSVFEILRIERSVSTPATGIGNTLWATPGNRLDSFTITPKQDTIKVLMLVCDTSRIISDFYKSVGGDYFYQNMVTWQFGYEVYEIDWGQIPCSDVELGTAAISTLCLGWKRIKFISNLDQNKKPLPRSLVVWLSKEIKN